MLTDAQLKQQYIMNGLNQHVIVNYTPIGSLYIVFSIITILRFPLNADIPGSILSVYKIEAFLLDDRSKYYSWVRHTEVWTYITSL